MIVNADTYIVIVVLIEDYVMLGLLFFGFLHVVFGLFHG